MIHDTYFTMSYVFVLNGLIRTAFQKEYIFLYINVLSAYKGHSIPWAYTTISKSVSLYFIYSNFVIVCLQSLLSIQKHLKTEQISTDLRFSWL